MSGAGADPVSPSEPGAPGNRLASAKRDVVLWLNAPLAWGVFLTVSGLNLVVGVLLQLLAWPWDRARRVALKTNHLLWGRALFAFQPGWHTTWEGKEGLGKGPYIVVANHSSVLDIPLCLGLPFPIRVLAKRSLTRVPLMGWYLRFSGQIPMDISSSADVQMAMEACQHSLTDGISLLIFPEGTRSEDAQLTRFGRGAFRLSKDTGVPVLPVAIHGTHRLMRKGRLVPQAVRHAVAVRVLAPVEPGSFTTARKMSNQVHAQISEGLNALRQSSGQSASYEATVTEAAEGYKRVGRWAHGFASGKMRADPAYRSVLRHLSPQSTGLLIDMGCGEGHLLALVRQASPGMDLLGVDHDEARVGTARTALGPEPRLSLASCDARQVDLPVAEVICCLDLLHYLPPEAQDALLLRLVGALAPGGLLLLRDGRSDAGWRSALTRWSEQLAVATGRHRGEGVFFRREEELRAVLVAAGLSVDVQACSYNTPFANMMWIGRRPLEQS